jgi:hypothetical protein
MNQSYGTLAKGASDSPAPPGLLIAGSTPVACLKTALIGKLATISRLIGVLETAVRLQVDVVQSNGRQTCRIVFQERNPPKYFSQAVSDKAAASLKRPI